MPIALRYLRIAFLAGIVLPALAWAQGQQDYGAWFQSTYVWQGKPSFNSAYSGTNSLRAQRERSYSLTATASLGMRPWAGAELYFNPEMALGVPFSGLTGLGGITNGELARTAGPTPVYYPARLFLRQTWGLGGGSEQIDSDANQLAGSVDKRRLVLTAGNLSVMDLFDGNAYSHDARTDFMNWALVTHGAYDFAADARGYTWGSALEYFHDNWAFRAGRCLVPLEPNQMRLDAKWRSHYGDQFEVERGHELAGQPGKLRLLVYRNRSLMSRYEDALDAAARTPGTVPDLHAVRTSDQVKKGIGVNVEQALNADLGVFGRAMWADGKTETYAYTEIDRSVAAGLVLKGGAWRRPQDTVGAALAVNSLSLAHRNYLAAGGLGFFIGDGRLNYRPEGILETYYSIGVAKSAWVTFNWQHIRNPAYNADRGPVNVGSLRLHTEF